MLTSILRDFLDHTSEKTRARFKALLLLLSARRIRSMIVLESQQTAATGPTQGTSTTARYAQSKHTGPSGPYEQANENFETRRPKFR